MDKRFVLVVLWATFALFGALLSARPYPHYLQQLAAPVSLLVPFIFVAENLVTWLVIACVAGAATLVQGQIKFGLTPPSVCTKPTLSMRRIE